MDTYDVFLSHGSPDKPWVRTLHDRLTSAGVVAYLDEVEIAAGDNFVCNLSDGIGRTKTFVIVVSQDTVGRPWVEHEWTSFMATHGPKNRIIPVLLDQVALPPFLRPFQVIHAMDRNAEAVAARIARAVGKGMAAAAAAPYTGQSLVFTIASDTESEQLAVSSADGVMRTITPPWRSGNRFGIALLDFEKLTREPALSEEQHARLVQAAQTLGTALFDLLFSGEDVRSTFVRASAPGARAVVTVRSDEDVLLSLPWELLVHESRFLVRDGVIDVVRSTSGAVQFETQLVAPRDPFAVLTHIAAPEGSALNYEAERFRLTYALTDHCSQTATELGTLDDLVETVGRAKPRGIHFSGHGVPGALIFENEDGFEHRVEIGLLVTALRQRGDGALPPFFFLAGCHGNTPAQPAERESGSSSSAAQLHREGVTEVVGYYGPIGDELSTRAEVAIYAAIAAGATTRVAVAEARAALQRPFEGEAAQKTAGALNDVPAPARGTSASVHAAPFAWAQLVFYHRGPEHPLGTPASPEQLRQREAALQRTYDNVADRAFLATGFIGRRQELHLLRRKRRRGDRVFVLQGLGGLGKTTLAGHLLPLLADTAHTVMIWCRRSEGEHDQAEALVGQLLGYARTRFGPGFEQVVSEIDRLAGDNAARRFAGFLQAIVAQRPQVPVVVYLDNLESLLQRPDAASLDTAPDSAAFASWRSDALQDLWQALVGLAGATGHLYVVASCRYRNDDLRSALVSVSPLAEGDLFRLMAWFPALRRLSTRSRARLATRLSGHPRAVEFLDALIAGAIQSWEETHDEWTTPSPRDEDAARREWGQLVAPVLPKVQGQIWSDLLLGVLWDRVLDEPARRMLLRMTLLRLPWDDALLVHLGEPEDDAEAARRTADRLTRTSLLERVLLTVRSDHGDVRRPFFAVHTTTAAFLRLQFSDADLVATAHRRIGAYLEGQARTSASLPVVLEAGHHFFQAGDYERALHLLGPASEQLQDWGRVREGLQILLPFLAETVKERLPRELVVTLSGIVGNACYLLSETRRAIGFYEQALAMAQETGNRSRTVINALNGLGQSHFQLGDARRTIDYCGRALVIARETGDRDGEGVALHHLGNVYASLGETRRAIEHHEQALVISRDIGSRRGELNALGSLGNICLASGETRRAIAVYEQVLTIVRETGNRRGEASVNGNLGIAYATLGEIRRAIEFFELQLAIVREIGDRRGEGNALGGLGTVYGNLGDACRAMDLFEQQLIIVREIGDRGGEGHALGNLGHAYLAPGQIHSAIDCFEKGLAIGRALGDPQIIGLCGDGLKRCLATRKLTAGAAGGDV